MTRGWIATGAALLLLAALGAGARAEEADTVSLRFGWPDAVVLSVERAFEREEVRPSGETPPPVRSEVRYRWTGTRSGDEYRIAFSDFEVVRAEPRPATRDALVQLEHVSRAVEPLLPTLVVDSAGQLLRLEGLAPLRERMLAEYRAIPGLEQDPQASRMLGVLTSDAMLEGRAPEDWNRMVQVWQGEDAEVGGSAEQVGTTGEPAGISVENVFTYAVERRLPCSERDAAASCVRLSLTQEPRGSKPREAAQALLGFDFVRVFGAPEDAELVIRNRFVTDTRPGSLLPARYVKEKRWSVSWQDASGAPRRVGRADRWSYRLTPIEPAAEAGR